MNKETIQSNIHLADKNWFQTGGNAKFYSKPASTQEFQETIIFANNNKLEPFILGAGANILISDDGFDGLVIHPHMQQMTHEPYEEKHAVVHAQAGVQIEDLIDYCLDNNIIGLEEFSGIPGTVGGSLYINIHYFSFFLSDFLVGATVIDRFTGKIKQVDKQWFKFGYDTSKLFEKKYYLLQASFKLKKASEHETYFAKGRNVEIIRHRNARYPTSHTCGSFFRNFHDHEVELFIDGTNKKMIYVAYYLDKLGVKGHLKEGDAVVSHKHANMIVNKGNATSTDIVTLAKKMQLLAKENFGIVPQAECQLIGFKAYPLLRT